MYESGPVGGPVAMFCRSASAFHSAENGPWSRYSDASYWHPASSVKVATVESDALMEIAPPTGKTHKMWERAGWVSFWRHGIVTTRHAIVTDGPSSRTFVLWSAVGRPSGRIEVSTLKGWFR
jgi:hypothetical protein